MSHPALKLTPAGLYCEPGGFYIDPWKPVDRAVITHAHADHARPGSSRYLCAEPGREVLQTRMGADATIDSIPYGKPQTINSVQVTLYPAGHILGASQVRVEHRGHVCVVSGDYKRQEDPTCESFEPVRCHTFVTESTFGLPIFRWPDPFEEAKKIDAWWRQNQAQGKASLLLAYSLGKAQRILASVDREIGPIYTHGAVEKLTDKYRNLGIDLPDTTYVNALNKPTDWSESLIVAPPATLGTPWTRRFGRLSSGMASGWMQIRGNRRRRAMDRGFLISDHVDWPDLIRTIEETEAEQVWVTHGYTDILVRFLCERGVDASVLRTEYGGDEELASEDDDSGDLQPQDIESSVQDCGLSAKGASDA